MLALRQGRVVDVDGLVDGLWGEELPAAPRNALHHHIARLRAALGEESIVGSPDGYALKDARVDAVRFEELLAETRAALRDGGHRCRGGRGRLGAGALARACAAGPDRQRRGSAPRHAGSRRCTSTRSRRTSRSGSRSASIASSRRRSVRRSRQPFPRAAVGAADAGALPQRPPGRCAGDVPGGAARARRRVGARAGAGAPAAPGGDPRARPGDRRRPCRP